MTMSVPTPVRLAEFHGPVLGGRALAADIRQDVQKRVERGEEVVLDLDGVVAVTPSFADELFGKLPTDVGQRVHFENISAHLQAVADMARAGRPGSANGS